MRPKITCYGVALRRAEGAKIVVDMSQWGHRLSLRVRFAETDANRHVSQVSYLIYFEEARTEFMAEAVPDFDWFGANTTLVLARQWIDYLSPAFFPDRLDIWTAPVHLGGSSLRMAHVITRLTDGDARIVARGESTMVQVSSANGRSTPWTAPVRSQLAAWLKPELAIPFALPTSNPPAVRRDAT